MSFMLHREFLQVLDPDTLLAPMQEYSLDSSSLV
jgi:hypothetical protein